jgi:hypothetical protein
MQLVDTRMGLNQPVEVAFARYRNGQIALTLVCPDGDDWLTATSAVDAAIPGDAVAVKDWSENEGVPDLLIAGGLIEPAPFMRIRSGFVAIPVYRLTAAALGLVQP